MKIFLSIQNASIGYHDKIILENITATLAEHSIIALMGENGIGKSCLLKTIARLLPLKSGMIKIFGQDINHLTQIEFAKTVAVVLTEKINVDFLKVSELIEIGRSPHLNAYGTMNSHDSKVIDDVLNLLGINELRNKYYSDLSDGQKQKSLIARALAQDPKVLILDEPTTYLDIPSRIDLMKALKKISNEKSIAIIFSTHDADIAREFSTQIWYINSLGLLTQESSQNVKKLFVKSELE